jgi:hypothetical protein
MTVVNEGAAFRKSRYGNIVRKSQALSAATLPVLTVAGGEVMITSLILKVTTAITTDSGTLALAVNPTTGDTVTVVAATDLGTTDSAAGTLIGVVDESTTTPDFRKGGRALTELPVPTGQVELVGAAAINGTVEVICTWVALTDGATLVAA